MKKTLIASLMLMVMVMAQLTGCSSDDATSGEQEISKTEDSAVVEIRLTSWGDFTQGDVESLLVEEFNSTHDDIKISFEPLPGDSYGQKLAANFAAGTACDIFLIGEGDYSMYHGQGVTTNLNEYFAKSETFDIDAYNKGLITMATFDGEVHYLPKDFNPIALYYNKDMFDATNLEYPDETWTYEDLERVAKTLTNAEEGTYGFYADPWLYTTMMYMMTNGADIGNEDATKAEGYVNSEAAIDAVTRYTNYILVDKISPSSSFANDLGGATSMFQEGKVAMFISGGWNIGTLDTAGANYGTTAVPMGSTGKHSSIICAAGFAINNKSEHKEEAFEVLEWMSGPEAHAARSANSVGILPAFNDQLEAKVAENPQVAGLAYMMEHAFKPVRMRSITGQYFDEHFNKALEEILLAGEDVKTALDKAAANIDEAIADH
ncbi:hypothetical protein AN639_01475 [Candidatus Epulonipiscium fishelsonii]|uniref:Uncharacterized protein n=1 Tax=Candidatus Epulonipiscium fishelsonii TaxID=77094 RepID=A0ACC8XC51_9FIRM|nr:hypothetical protein AN639_01475 [Epulopiscium sp. SCG-B05WGA-EpuloA1]ONI40000.1 hypothetical protein AN396_06530 [Epulopiscium sp. SCG-B11WGA-EpuloA1]